MQNSQKQIPGKQMEISNGFEDIQLSRQKFKREERTYVCAEVSVWVDRLMIFKSFCPDVLRMCPVDPPDGWSLPHLEWRKFQQGVAGERVLQGDGVKVEVEGTTDISM